ncbi:MAG: EAL domain-containing protein [Eubacteriales bacterium]|nr:EAL domain-containing protein [Eubacteriales bacterium]
MNQTDRILKKELSLSRRDLIGIAIGMAAFYILSIVFCFGIYSSTKGIVSRQAARSITNISQLNKDSVSGSLMNLRALLETLSVRLEESEEEDGEAILRELEDFGRSFDLFKIGFMDQSRMAYFTDGTSLDASGLPVAEEVWDDQFHLTESHPPYSGGEYMVNTLSYPVCFGGELRYVLIANYYSIRLTERMNLSAMGGKGCTFLLNGQGGLAIYPRHYENEAYNALMEHINHNPEIIPTAGGDSTFSYKGRSYFAHFEELGINGWILMTCVRQADVFADARSIMWIVYASVGALWLCILLGLGYHFSYVRRTRLRRTKETFYDDLLNIPNKRALSVVYEKLPRQVLEQMYLVVFDIDKFKEFNYIYGSGSGDRLLEYIARVFQEVEPDSYLFRYMSDYFVALDVGKSHRDYERKLDAVLERFQRDREAGIIQPFGISGGVRRIQPGESLQLVISDALVARGTVKGSYLRSYAFYDEGIRNRRLSYMEMESSFSAALRGKEFQVYYQPKFDMRTGKIIGAEALARWIKPDGRIVSPGDFIPCLEASRQIIRLDEEILRQVCSQMKEMEREGLEVRRVSVNLSRIHLRNPGILEKIQDIIRRSGVDPSLLSFEVTETVLYEDSIPLKTIVDSLHAMGCKVEMDDYGVGVSGPNSLAKNSFDVVKLDKSLADGLGNERVEDVIRSTAFLARKWGMKILVEGVEEQSQADRLMELGCFYAQGFYYSRPLPEREYRALLKAGGPKGPNEK